MRQIICIVILVSQPLFSQEVPRDEYDHPPEDYYKKFIPLALSVLRTSESDVGFEFSNPPALFAESLKTVLRKPLSGSDKMKEIMENIENLDIRRVYPIFCSLSLFFKSSMTVADYTNPELFLGECQMVLSETFGEHQDTLLSLAGSLLKDDAALLNLDPYEEYALSLEYRSFVTSFTLFACQIDLSGHAAVFNALLEHSDFGLFDGDASPCPYSEGEIVKWKDTPQGPIIIGGLGSNVYRFKTGIIIDMGGDDVYYIGENFYSVTMIIDAEGDDKYFGTDDFSIAGTFGGVSVLIDSSGDDLYRGGYASVASSIFGISLLEDIEGDDTYLGKVGTCGSSACGVASLIDRSGEDRFISYAYSQGCSGVSGVGIFADIEGNDSYICKGAYLDDLRFSQRYLSFGQGFSIGLRPDLPGGFGLLLDGGGNDSYDADVFSQACSYWYGFGGIYDKSGNDSYLASQYSQGSGVHLALGILLDSDGDDTYISKSVSQGCGHDFSTGILVDEGGDDFYSAEGLCQGAGNANSWSIFVESAGDDLYSVKISENSRGWSDTRRGYRGTGLFLDIRGDDSYLGIGDDSLVFLRPDLGLFADIEDGF
ncbi:hypothetical protein JXA84_09565 [candidate division WOR-3 bacterium]|nr:hypothetical protein [candidate division WOR-3 bacterium]